jgi:pyruvate decarboxylase
MLTKLYSGEFTEKIREEITVDFQRFFVKIGGVRFDVKMKYVRSTKLFRCRVFLTDIY